MTSGFKKCHLGWPKTGECCCNCKHQLELFKHPWNIINKGSVRESTKMYACIVEHLLQDNYNAIIFEKKHGFCELYMPRIIR